MEMSLAQLDNMNAATRQRALRALVAMERAGELPPVPEQPGFNLHAHTFFSYNGAGYSPSHLVWRAHRQGWWALATVDFDVLDSVDETMQASEMVGLRASGGIETRVFAPELHDTETNSPGEPGVMYLIGVGFTQAAPPPAAAPVLADMRTRAQRRNREMIARINAHLAPVSIDLDRDVAPMTPAGNVTERHMLVAYDRAARAHYHSRAALVSFWADRLGLSPAAVEVFLGDAPFPHDAIRSKLMKRGGVGYAQPGPETFPSLPAVADAIVACGAIPTYGFVDGMSAGEARLDALLELMIAQGAGGLTIIPDRNWNIQDPAEKATKLAALHSAIALAERVDLPVLAGTEMNRPGQRELDDFTAPELRPFWPVFQRGAAWLWGHTVLQRLCACGYQSAWARGWLPSRGARNAFFAQVGAACGPNDARLESIMAAAPDGPEAVRAVLGL
jgi:hypothetical protein